MSRIGRLPIDIPAGVTVSVYDATVPPNKAEILAAAAERDQVQVHQRRPGIRRVAAGGVEGVVELWKSGL